RISRLLFAQRRARRIMAVPPVASCLSCRQRSVPPLPFASRFHIAPALLCLLFLCRLCRSGVHARDRTDHVSRQRRLRNRRILFFPEVAVGGRSPALPPIALATDRRSGRDHRGDERLLFHGDPAALAARAFRRWNLSHAGAPHGSRLSGTGGAAALD